MTHDIAQFRAAWQALTPRRKEDVRARCSGASLAEISARRGVTVRGVRNNINFAYETLRSLPGMERVGPHGMAEAVCWRLGYEAALSDIEARIAAKRQAA